jgi:hypothetical protein
MMRPWRRPAAVTESPPSASAKRAANPLFVPMWSVQALLPQLPLLFPVAPNLPPSPKRRYRSQYRYLGAQDLRDEAHRATLSDLEIALRLIDCSPLERLLAQYYVQSAKGEVPFHPVSMFLAICLRRELNLPWRRLARLLGGDNGAGWRTLFGFTEGQTPSEAGLRHFFNAVGPARFDELCPRFIELLHQHGLCPQQSTYPGDPPDRGVTVSQDGMLHPALSRPSCQLPTDTCYQPLPATPSLPMSSVAVATGPVESDAGKTPRRPCRAIENGLPGCLCDTAACAEHCRRASRLDREARFIHYEGHNDKQGKGDGPGKERQGVDIFGYRSIADRLLDDRFAVAWTTRSKLYPANTDERSVFIPNLTQAKEDLFRLKKEDLSGLKIGEWLDDSGVGYEPCLSAIYELGALRLVDIRGDRGDHDPEVCLRRGYDGQGRPLCAHGYVMRSNGYDEERRRTKYLCAQVCRRAPRREGEPVAAVQGCPYLDERRPLGQVTNIGRTMPDGTMRLAREIPYGSPPWKARYGRRNLSESRNGQLEGLGLKRMRSYGLKRNSKEVQLADFVINLRTLGRLVREASDLYQD